MRPWFGPKDRYDFGVASWQGWLTVIVSMAALWGVRIFLVKPEIYGLPYWAKHAAMATVVLAIFALIYATYDRDP